MKSVNSRPGRTRRDWFGCCRTFGMGPVLTVCVVVATSIRLSAQAPQAEPAGSSQPPVVFFARDLTRVEMWRFFEPRTGGGDPDYADIATRVQFGVERRTRRYEFVAALQYVQFAWLPTRATGPGPLGTGSLYFDQSGTTTSHQFYVRYLNITLKDIVPGWTVRAGRMGYTSGAESSSANPKVEAVKRQRVDARLLGEFEWSLYQRGYDGVRTDLDRKGWHVSAAALRPTQGGFEDAAGAEIVDIGVFAATVTAKPGRVLKHTDWQAFAIRYNDDRAVRQRPDNTGRTTTGVDVHISTFGTTLAGAYPVAPGRQLDALLWLAGQTGDWFGQAHRASAVAVEGGIQWTAAPGKPWLRGGLARASGDSDPSDTMHNTFFQVLPTVRKYSLSATYSLMNLTDVFAQVLATPRPPLSLRVDVHRLTLTDAADRWYFGSGATQSSGTVFGYGGRPSLGATGLGTVVEGSADYRVNRHWSVNGYLGTIRGGEVVRNNFAGQTLVFGYLENVVAF